MKYFFISKIYFILFYFHLTVFSISFPNLPTYSGSISSFVENFLIYLGEIILYPFEYVIYAIGSGIGQGLGNLFSSLFGMASTTYTSSVKSFGFAGPLAPILVSIVWGISLVIIIFFILMAIHLIWGGIQDDTGD